MKKKLALFFGGGGTEVFSRIEKTFWEFDFAILNYWAEGGAAEDSTDPEEYEDMIPGEIDWGHPAPSVLELRFDMTKYEEARPIDADETGTEYRLAEFESLKQSSIARIKPYREIYLFAFLDNEITDTHLINFIRDLNHPDCKPALIFPMVLPGSKRFEKTNSVLESLIDLDIRHWVIFLDDLKSRDESMLDFLDSAQVSMTEILTEIISGNEINDQRVYSF